MSYRERLNKVGEDALQLIKHYVKLAGTIELTNDEELGDTPELLYELPYVVNVGKYYIYDEYAVLSISHKDDKFTLHTRAKNDNANDEDFTLEEIDLDNMCDLADMIEDLK